MERRVQDHSRSQAKLKKRATCKHKVCKRLKKTGACGSLSVVLAVQGEQPHVLLVKQSSGQYADKYSICSGKRDDRDHECWVATAVREIREEMKLGLTEAQFLQLCGGDKNTRMIRKGPTPVFIGIVTDVTFNADGLTLFRDQLNAAIDADRANTKLPDEYREIERVDWFDLALKLFPTPDDGVLFSMYAHLVMTELAQRYGKLLRQVRKAEVTP